jgi:hypothetical protein
MEVVQIILIGSIVFLGCVVVALTLRLIELCRPTHIRIELEEPFRIS